MLVFLIVALLNNIINIIGAPGGTDVYFAPPGDASWMAPCFSGQVKFVLFANPDFYVVCPSAFKVSLASQEIARGALGVEFSNPPLINIFPSGEITETTEFLHTFFIYSPSEFSIAAECAPAIRSTEELSGAIKIQEGLSFPAGYVGVVTVSATCNKDNCRTSCPFTAEGFGFIVDFVMRYKAPVVEPVELPQLQFPSSPAEPPEFEEVKTEPVKKITVGTNLAPLSTVIFLLLVLLIPLLIFPEKEEERQK